MKNQTKSLVSTLLLVVLIGAGVFTFTHAFDMADGSHHVGNCPLIPGQQALCRTDPVIHLTLWQKSSTTDLEIFSYLLLLLSALGVVFSVYTILSDNHGPPRKSVIRAFHAQLPIDLYTRMLSNGLLNPKIY